MRNAVEKANILSQALPYIQKYNHKIIVVKYGGNAMENEVLKKKSTLFSSPNKIRFNLSLILLSSSSSSILSKLA